MRSYRTAGPFPMGARAYMRAGAWYARLVYIDGRTGSIYDGGPEVAMTQEGSTLNGLSLSGTTMLIGLAGGAGTSGAIESNSARWVASFASLGLPEPISGNTRPTNIRLVTDSMDDNSVARAGTGELFCYFGTGSSTDAGWGAGLQRHTTGTLTFRAISMIASDLVSGVGSITASAATAGVYVDGKINSATSGILDLRALTNTGDFTGSVTTSSSASVTNAPPSHLVIAATMATGNSDFRLFNPRALITFQSTNLIQ